MFSIAPHVSLQPEERRPLRINIPIHSGGQPHAHPDVFRLHPWEYLLDNGNLRCDHAWLWVQNSSCNTQCQTFSPSPGSFLLLLPASFQQLHGIGNYQNGFCVSRVSIPSFKQDQGLRNEFLQTQCWSPSSHKNPASPIGRQCVATFTTVYTGNQLKLDQRMERFPHTLSHSRKKQS